eukprot:9350231-Pyramimonas_sp.AAC.1
MHPVCINAARAYMRQIQRSPGAIKQMEHEMDNDAPSWRRKVAPFIDNGKGASRRDARAAASAEPSKLALLRCARSRSR